MNRSGVGFKFVFDTESFKKVRKVSGYPRFDDSKNTPRLRLYKAGRALPGVFQRGPLLPTFSLQPGLAQSVNISVSFRLIPEYCCLRILIQ